MQISQNVHFQVNLQVDHRWLLTLICDLLTAWTYEDSHIISINQIWFQSTFREGPFSHFQPYNLTSDDLWLWYMTFDHMHIWRFPYNINKPSLVPIVLQRFQWGNSHIFSLSYNLNSDDPLTLICNLWPHQPMQVPMLHLWPNFG